MSSKLHKCAWTGAYLKAVIHHFAFERMRALRVRNLQSDVRKMASTMLITQGNILTIMKHLNENQTLHDPWNNIKVNSFIGGQGPRVNCKNENKTRDPLLHDNSMYCHIITTPRLVKAPGERFSLCLWTPSQKTRDVELWCFLQMMLANINCWTVELSVIWDAMTLLPR